jgi:hypothetical protein
LVYERWLGVQADGVEKASEGAPLNKRSTRGRSSRRGYAGVVLRPAHLQPLSDEQRDEAIALFSDLLLAAARPRVGDRAIMGDTEDREQELAA